MKTDPYKLRSQRARRRAARAGYVLRKLHGLDCFVVLCAAAGRYSVVHSGDLEAVERWLADRGGR